MLKTYTFNADKERTVRYGFRYLSKVEEELGKPIASLGEDMTMKDIAIIVKNGLVWEDKKLTLDTTYDIIDSALETTTFNDFFKEIMECLQSSYGKTPTSK